MDCKDFKHVCFLPVLGRPCKRLLEFCKKTELLGSQLGIWLAVNFLTHLVVGLLLGGRGTGFPLPAFGWTTLFAFCFWYPCVLHPATRRPWALRAFWGLWTVWTLVVVLYRRELGSYPDQGTAEFLCAEPAYALAMARESSSVWMLLMAPLPALAGWGLAKGIPGPRVSRRWLGSGLLATLALLVICNRMKVSPVPMGADVTSLRMLAEFRFRRTGAKGALRCARSREAVPRGGVPPFHVLLLVHESLNAQAFDPELMPGLGRRLVRGEALGFPKAYASATMTDIALPALMAGPAPFERGCSFRRAPLLWHRAQAHGMATAFFSVQDMDFHGFRDFFMADGLDARDTAKDAKLPELNSRGGDDGWLPGRFEAWLLPQLQAGRTTFTVLQFNATHRPFLQMPGFTPWTEADVARRRPDVAPRTRSDLARYWNAMAYLDHVQEQVMAVLARNGILDRTLVVGTSDHGECFVDGGLSSRMENLRPETLHVPLWVHLPRKFPPQWQRALAANRERLVGNLDLVPTFAQALGSPVPPIPFRGSSLLEPLPVERFLPSTNTSRYQPRSPEVASLLWEEGGRLRQWRWHAQEGDSCYDVDGDRAIRVAEDVWRQRAVGQALAGIPAWAGRCEASEAEEISPLRRWVAHLFRHEKSCGGGAAPGSCPGRSVLR